jgi:hypothetical protein
MQTPLIHSTTSRFWQCYDQLLPEIPTLADDNFRLLKSNPRHPSLHFKQIGRFWSVRVSLRYRALGVATADGVVWFWIGNHADYDRMIN